jgi:hypothetical protein
VPARQPSPQRHVSRLRAVLVRGPLPSSTVQLSGPSAQGHATSNATRSPPATKRTGQSSETAGEKRFARPCGM